MIGMIICCKNKLHSDHLLAFAIDHGIVEVSIDILIRNHNEFYHNSHYDELLDALLRFANSMSGVSMWRISSKAVVRKREILVKALRDACCLRRAELTLPLRTLSANDGQVSTATARNAD